MLNYNANMVYQSGLWHPAPSSSGVSFTATNPAYPGVAVPSYSVLTPMDSWGVPLGEMDATNPAVFLPTYSGMYHIEAHGMVAVPGDGLFVSTTGTLRVDAGEDIYVAVSYYDYGTLVAHWISVGAPSGNVTNGVYAMGTFNAAEGFGGRLNLVYLGPSLATGVTLQQPPPQWPPLMKNPPKGP